MKRIFTQIATMFIAFTSLNANAQNQSSTVWLTVKDLSILPATKEGRLISDNLEMQSLINNYQITKVEQAVPASKKDNLQKVYEMSCDCDAEVLVAELNKSHLAIEMPEVGPVYQFAATPNDYNQTFATDYALDNINAEQAWDITTGDPNVEIAITDSGYDTLHEELQGTVTYTQNMSMSNYHHGTAVATIAAGNTNNGQGKSHIGYDCSLQLRSTSYNSILQASYSGARVINVSWYSSCSYSYYIQDIIDEAYNNGSIIVAAAGNGTGTCNGPSTYVYPAALDHVISVSSVGPSDNHERTIGDSTTTHQHNDKVDLCAPGYDVALTVASGWYLTGNGSSFASPMVAGTVGLMLSVNPCLSYEDVDYILKQTAVNIDAINPQYAGKLGAGRLDAYQAVLMASQYNAFPVELSLDYQNSCVNGEGSADVKVITDLDDSLYTVNWSTGVSSDAISNLTDGTYWVEVSNAQGCSVSDTFEIQSYTAVEFELELTEPTCPESNDGSIVVVPLNFSDGMVNYQWNIDANTTNSLTNASVGTYTVTLTDTNNCVVDTVITLNGPDAIEIETIVEGNTIEASVVGGTPDYFYNWSTGEVDSRIEVENEGDYVLEVEDNNGCSEQVEVRVESDMIASIDSEEMTEVTIYPNPSNGNATITFDASLVNQINVFNSAGQLVVSESNLYNNQLDINFVDAGVYFVQVQYTNNQIQNQKLVVE